MIEGYAALFGVADGIGDVIRAGAFTPSIASGRPIPMLVRHDPRLVAGAWLVLKEDARGLFVRGRIDPAAPAGALAERLIARGVDGLSIGFFARDARPRAGGGRELAAIDLIEISIVPVPMVRTARLRRVTQERTIA